MITTFSVSVSSLRAMARLPYYSQDKTSYRSFLSTTLSAVSSSAVFTCLFNSTGTWSSHSNCGANYSTISTRPGTLEISWALPCPCFHSSVSGFICVMIRSRAHLVAVPEEYVQIVQDMYRSCKTQVVTQKGETEYFPIEVGLHQGSALSPLLFIIIMDVLTVNIEKDPPWAMMFADDLVLCALTRE